MNEELQRFQQGVDRAKHIQSQCQFLFDTLYHLPYQVDEVSLLFKRRETLRKFAFWAKELGGMDRFDSTTDTMKRTDRHGQFAVEFHFLRFPDADWRIEAMAVTSGFAPLHTRHLMQLGDVCPVHASFKVSDKAALSLAADRLQSVRMRHRASYRNSYGAFSYWDGIGRTYIKPRINLRDRAVVA